MIIYVFLIAFLIIAFIALRPGRRKRPVPIEDPKRLMPAETDASDSEVDDVITDRLDRLKRRMTVGLVFFSSPWPSRSLQSGWPFKHWKRG